MKIIFVGRSSAHITYYNSFIKKLLYNKNDVHFLLDRKWSKNILNKEILDLQKFENFSCDWIDFNVNKNKFRKIIYLFREYKNFLWHKYVIKNQTDFYINRYKLYVDKLLIKINKLKFLKFIFLNKYFLNILEIIDLKVIRPNKDIVSFLKIFSPDRVFFCPLNMRFGTEIEYLKACIYLNIPRYLIVYSWDNLTTKGKIPFNNLNKVFLFNEYQKLDATNYHNINPTNIHISGSTFFDNWFEFVSKNIPSSSIDTPIINQNYILYLGSSSNIAKDETWVLDALIQVMNKSLNEYIQNIHIVIRPHPANFKIYEKYKNYEKIHLISEDNLLPNNKNDYLKFKNYIHHSLLNICINSSAIIDSIINKKKVLSPIIEEYTSTQKDAIHFKYLYNSGLIDTLRRLDDFEDYLISYLEKNELFIRQNKVDEFIRLFINPTAFEKRASDIIYEEIIKNEN